MSGRELRLGDLFSEVRNGKNVKQDKSGEGTLVTRIETISSGSVDPWRVGFTDEAPADEDPAWLRPGDLLFSHINSPHRVGVVALYDGQPERLYHGINLLRLRPNPERIDPKFALHLLRTPLVRQRVRRFVNQAVNQASISATNLKSISVPVPPIEEQRRIAAVLDAAEGLRVKRRQAFAKLDTFAQAIFFDMFGDPLPTESPSARELSDVAQFVRGITFKPDDVLKASDVDTVAVMRTSNVQETLDLTDVWHVPRSFVKRPEQVLRAHDTLISSANSWYRVGACCLVPAGLPETTLGGFLTALRPSGEELRPRYLHTWFSSPKVQQTVRSFGRQTTNISNLNLKLTAKLPIPAPPVADQLEFERALDAIEAHSRTTQAASQRLDDLFASLQQRSFRGEL